MWETVKTLRTVKNILWLIIVLIIIAFIFKRRTINSVSGYDNSNVPTQKTETENYNALVSVSGGLNLRSEPNSDAAIIKSISNNAKIFVTDFNGPADTLDEEPGNWYHVTYKNFDGWVWGNFVTTIRE